MSDTIIRQALGTHLYFGEYVSDTVTVNGADYTVNTHDLQDQAVTYYSSYLASIAQNGMGIENLKIGEVFISYNDEDPYGKYLDMARNALLQKNALSITTSNYNADPTLGDVDWKKNIDGSNSTLNVRQKPRNIN